MKRIDEARLEADLGYRFGYLAEFMGFGPADIAAIHAAAGPLGPPSRHPASRVEDRATGSARTRSSRPFHRCVCTHVRLHRFHSVRDDAAR